MRIREEALIPVPAGTLWAVLTEWERQASWMPDVARVEVVGQERGLGTELAVRTKVLGLPLVADRLRVIAWEPPRRLAVDHAGLVTGLGEWLLEPDPSGGTRLTWTEELEMPPPVLGAAALRLYAPIQRRMLRRSLDNLRRLVTRR